LKIVFFCECLYSNAANIAITEIIYNTLPLVITEVGRLFN